MTRASVLALLLTLFGCAPSGMTGPSGPTDPGPVDPVDPVDPDLAEGFLEIVGPAVVATEEGGELELVVRYVDRAGNPLAGTISFAIEGAAGGASLSAMNVPTDAEGLARVTVRTGSEASFPVAAVAPLAMEPAVWTVQVQPMAMADLEVVPTYEGARVIDDVEVALFTNLSCEDLAAAVPSPRGVEHTELDRGAVFEAVETGVPLAIYAFGINPEGHVAAARCDNASIAEDTEIGIRLVDVDFVRGGRYTTEEVFDVTDGFNPHLDAALDALRGLTTDPAGYIVDTAIEAADLPGWAETVLSSPSVRAEVAGLIEEAILDVHLPGFVVETAEGGADIDRAFTGLTLVGELTLVEPTEFGEANGEHRILEVRAPVSDGAVSVPLRDATSEVELSFGEDDIHLAEHSFEVPFGAIVEALLNEVLLPRLPGAPGSVNELLSNLVDCDGLGARVGDGGLMSSVAEVACSVGIALAADRIEDSVLRLWQYDVLTLDGRGVVSDDDMDYVTEAFDGGAHALWTGESGELEFNGTITGVRGDEVGERPADRVRDRMSDLR